MSGPTPVGVLARDWNFTHADREKPVFSGLNLQIEPGARVLLLGASGSGKSTLLAALAGVLEDDFANESGELLIGGVPAREARGIAGLMQQDPETQIVLPRLGDDVAFGAENLGVDPAEIWPRVREALDAVGLQMPLDAATSTLSGGQKQRLALAGILAMRPGLVLLDEPTANLDPDAVVQVRDAVLAALGDRAATLVVVEHRVAQWQAQMDRVIVLGAGGQVVADGVPAEVFAEHGADLFAAGIWVPDADRLLADEGFGRRSSGALGSGSRSSGGRSSGSPRSGDPRSGVAETGDTSSGGADSQPGAQLLATEGVAVGRGRSRFRARGADAQEVSAVLTGVELQLRAGEAVALTGPNGAGKSTLALTIGGLLPPFSGQVLADDALARGASNQPIRWKAKQLVRRIGNVFQEPEHQFVTGSVRAELGYSLRHQDEPVSEAEIDARVAELLAILGLVELADVNPFTLSGGQKRRLSVASVLAASPPLLILDEPTFGQDSRTWRALVELLRGVLDAGSSVVFITHDQALIHALGAREVRVENGTIRG